MWCCGNEEASQEQLMMLQLANSSNDPATIRDRFRLFRRWVFSMVVGSYYSGTTYWCVWEVFLGVFGSLSSRDSQSMSNARNLQAGAPNAGRVNEKIELAKAHYTRLYCRP